MAVIKPLSIESLYQYCDISQFDFETTAELEDLSEIIGQSRALEAIHFGIGIKRDGYNLFALGPSGTGKHGVVTQLLSQKASSEPQPPEWCYVNNFELPHKPVKLCLPKGWGSKLKQSMDQLIDELATIIPAIFESDDYRNRIHELDEEFKVKQDEAIDSIRHIAKEQNIALIRTPNGFAFAPMKDGEVISPKDYKRLSSEDRKIVDSHVEELQEELQRVLNQIPQWRRDAREKLQKLNRNVTQTAVKQPLDKMREEYQEHPDVLKYFDAVEADVFDHIDEFRRGNEDDGELITLGTHGNIFKRYKVNVLVQHVDDGGAPVVYEDSPTYQNLVGRIEHLSMMGALITDFTLIKPGALHRANNGYLVLEADKVLQYPASWEALKRAMRSNEIRIGSLEQMLSLVSTVSLEPEPIPLDVKVVLVGDRMLYYLLHELDPEFRELFKVAADFDTHMPRKPENNQLYARLVATLARKDELKPFDKSGVARVIEHSSRLTGDSERLTTHMRSVCDLMCEADYWAGEHGHDFVCGDDVQMAINAQARRGSRMKDNLHESIQRNILLIDTSGESIGQLNGLTVIDAGDYAFGSPARITAQVRMGDGDVVDIEREVDLGGPIHSKGVMILSSFLGARYAKEFPLALSASLVFEQSYGEIEGDSASSTELYALLSALSGVPLKQSFAVTGSVNQYGQVQAIGGVNEKIEGFFDICKTRGLTGDQGVLIPQSNINDLMLRADVVAAVEEGKFAIYAVSTIDEGIELLTGVPAGEADEEGSFPEDSINHRVKNQLLQFAELRHEFGEHKKDSEDEEHKKETHKPEEGGSKGE